MSDLTSNTPTEWKNPPPRVNLDPLEVHVWRGALDRPSSELQAFWQVLNPIEQTRAQRFVSPRHKDRFVAAHGMVRHILALYTKVSPAELLLDKGSHGKPYLANPISKRLFFNLSHSNTLSLLAVTSLGEIGVDLEYKRPTLAYHAIADRIMCEEEKIRFRELPSDHQSSAFFSCWTRKEAFVKAHGRGLGYPFKEFSVAATPSDCPQLVPMMNEHPKDCPEWSMYDVFPGDEYAAALVVRGFPGTLRFWHFPDE